MSGQPVRYQTYQPSRKSITRTQPPRRSYHRTVVIAILAIILGSFGLFSFITNSTRGSSSSDDSVSAKSVTNPLPLPASVQQQVNAIIDATPNTQIGIAVENISTKQVETFGITSHFEAASTAKLITAAAYYHLVETGRASLSAPLGAFTAEYQIQQMVNMSNNESWSLLSDTVGLDELSAYALSIGVNYDVATNGLAPSDMTTFLAKLYSGQLLNKTDTKQLLSYMHNTNDETMIPAAVDSSITVYHKYGLLNGELHDAAILHRDSSSYALVIYTKGADDSDDTQRTAVVKRLTRTIVSSIF